MSAITREQVEALKAEAAAAGDGRMVHIAGLALRQGEESPAWLACEWAIEDAEAQS